MLEGAFYFYYSARHQRRANSSIDGSTIENEKSHCQTFQQQFHLRQHPPQQQKTEDVRTARKQVSG